MVGSPRCRRDHRAPASRRETTSIAGRSPAACASTCPPARARPAPSTRAPGDARRPGQRDAPVTPSGPAPEEVARAARGRQRIVESSTPRDLVVTGVSVPRRRPRRPGATVGPTVRATRGAAAPSAGKGAGSPAGYPSCLLTARERQVLAPSPVLAARYDATSAATASGHLLVRRPSACLHAELATASSGRRWPASRILAPYAGRHVRKRGAWMRGAR